MTDSGLPDTPLADATPTGTIIQIDAQRAALKAETLVESLPWLQRFHGSTFVIKIGGNAMAEGALLDAFAEDIVYLLYAGIRPVIVHGGGPQISAMLDKMGIESRFEHGYRVTTPESMDIVRMVLTGKISREIVGRLNHYGPIASGLSGEDAGLFKAQRTTHDANGSPIDLGLVGDVVEVDPTSVEAYLDAGKIPVVSSVAPDIDDPSHVLNVNADAAASALAVALKATKLVMLTNVAGLYANWPDRSSLISELRADELRELLPSLKRGMVPKMKACLDAVDGGVQQAAIVDGRMPHSSLLEIFTNTGIGTQVIA